MNCLCEANTNCDTSIKCVLNQFCGPYLISETYWTDASRHGHNYRSCAMNKTCSEETVQSYMAKNAVDCNDDGFIDCDDYVILHQLGPQCKTLAKTSNFYSSNYWNFYQYCHHLSPDSRRKYTIPTFAAKYILVLMKGVILKVTIVEATFIS